MNPDHFVNDLFQGVYLADDVFFPKDTLVLNQFQFSDSTKKKKLLVHFRNDSLFLSNYNFGGWYGKWFCDFRSAGAIFDNEKLNLHAQFRESAKWMCGNENKEGIWTKIEYQLIDSSDKSITYVKTLDTTNCISTPTFRNVMTHLGRGGRDFTSEDGEEIRSDIQLR